MLAAVKYGMVLTTILATGWVAQGTAQETREFGIGRAHARDYLDLDSKLGVSFPIRGASGLPRVLLGHEAVALGNRRKILDTSNADELQQVYEEQQQQQTVPQDQQQQDPQQDAPFVVVDESELAAPAGDPTTQESANALLKAAIAGDLTTVRTLVIEHQVSPEIQNMLGWTPLNLAALAGHLEVVRFLVEMNANLEAREIYGQTPLGSAAINGHLDVVRYLLNREMPANVSATDMDGAQPLHYAAQFGYVEVCRALLDKGADVNARVLKGGWTPLHAAAAAGQMEVIIVLMRRGGDPNGQDGNGMKPIQVVGVTMDVTKRRQRMIECLLEPNSVAEGCPPSSAPTPPSTTPPPTPQPQPNPEPAPDSSDSINSGNTSNVEFTNEPVRYTENGSGR